MIETTINCISTIIVEAAIIFMLKKITKKAPERYINNMVIIILVPLLQMIIYHHEMQIINPIITIGLIFYICKGMYKLNVKESLKYTILIWSFSVLIDILMMFIMNSIDLSRMADSQIQLLKSISSLGMSIILFALSVNNLFIKYVTKLLKRIDFIKLPYIIILLPISTFFLAELIAYTNMSNPKLTSITIIVSVLFVLVYSKLIIISYKNIEIMKTNDILEKNNKVNREIITNYRIIKHNIENNLRGIKTVSNRKGRELIDELIKEYNNSVYIKYDINSMPNGINGLMMEKIYNYKDYDIDLEIINRIKNNILDSVGSRKYNQLCEALGIVLDNALEAVIKCKEKIMFLEFKENDENIELIIANTFRGEINMDSIGTLEYTTKERGHGLGLFSILTKKSINISTNIKNNVYKNTITIKKLH